MALEWLPITLQSSVSIVGAIIGVSCKFIVVYVAFFLGCFMRILPKSVMQIWFVATFACAIPVLYVVSLLTESLQLFGVSKWWCSNLLCGANGVAFRVFGRYLQPHISMSVDESTVAWSELPRPCCLLLNHASVMDTIVPTACAPVSFLVYVRTMIKNVTFSAPLYGAVLRRCRHIAVHRISKESTAVDHAKQAAETPKLEEHLRLGGNLIIYPEGTRSPDWKTLGEFRWGIFKILLANRVPLFFFVGVGMVESWPNGATLGGLPSDIRVKLGRLGVDYNDPTLTAQRLAEDARRAMQHALDDLIRARGAAPSRSQ